MEYPKTRRVPWLTTRWLLCPLLLLVLCFISPQWAEGQAGFWNASSSFKVINHPNEAYIDFEVPAYDSDGADEWPVIGNICIFENLDFILSYEGAEDRKAVYKVDRWCADGADHWKNIGTRRSGDKYFTTFRWWYGPNYLNSKFLEIKFEADIKVNGKNGIFKRSYIDYSTVTTKQLPNPKLTLNGLDPQNVACWSISYSVESTEGAEVAQHCLPTNDGWKWVDCKDVRGSFSWTMNENQAVRDVKFKYGERKYLSNSYRGTVELPIYSLPKNFKVENVEGGATKISWTFDAQNNTFWRAQNTQGDDYFIVQRSTDPEFSSAKTENLSIDGQRIEIKRDQENYSIIDETGQQNVSGTIYYRICRASSSIWNWDPRISSQTSIVKSYSHAKLVDVKAELKNDSPGHVSISWTKESGSDNLVWTDGASVELIRSYVNTAGVTVEERTEIDSDDLFDQNGKGSYEDDDNSELGGLTVSCVSYSYKLRVTPRNGYPAFECVVKNENQLTISEICEINTLTASKGYYHKYVTLQWTTNGKRPEVFYLQRRRYVPGQDANASWEVFATQQASNVSSYVYTDERALGGVIYEYRVQALTNCAGNEETVTSRNTSVGFRSPTGSVTGKITYNNGTATPNVVVGLNGYGSNNGYALKFPASADANSTANVLRTDEAMSVPEAVTLQLYVKPSEVNSGTLVQWGQYILSLYNGKLSFGGLSDVQLPQDAYSQITVTYDGQKCVHYLNGKEVGSFNSILTSNVSSAIVYLGNQIPGGDPYQGCMDEVRLWSRALTAEEVDDNFDRVIVGNETGLEAYFHFNAGVATEFYDSSFKDETYNAHHGQILGSVTNVNAVADVPTTEQLALKARTTASGVYTINNVPYSGNGTTYTITPSYPNHTFAPTSSSISIGESNSLISGQDFTDNSSITVKGYVFYEQSSIPVVGAQFAVNNVTVMSSKGEIVMTKSDGSFEIEVPVGQQQVKVVKANHTFLNDGLLLDSKGEDINYQQPIADVRFWDNTKVKLVGRVVGGAIESDKPYGFSLSKNNLGDAITMTLDLAENRSAEIYDIDAVYENGVQNPTPPEFLEETITHFDGLHSNTVKTEQYVITIKPDVETGEFEAMLYPVKYKVRSLTVTGWDEISTKAAGEIIDLENVFVTKTSKYEVSKDTTEQIEYNERYVYAHRVTPTIHVTQGDAWGYTMSYFGSKDYYYTDLSGEEVKIPLYDTQSGMYLFGRDESHPNGLPIFESGNYGFHIEASEDFVYNGTEAGEKPVVDNVPTSGGSVSVSNGFNRNNTPVEGELSEDGHLYVELVMNQPRFALNDLGSISVSVGIEGATYTAPKISGLLIGPVSGTGTDFVTAGPITLLDILRDPPGSKSYSYIEAGTSYNYEVVEGIASVEEGEYTGELFTGLKYTSVIGTLGTETKDDASASINVKTETKSNDPHTRSVSYEITERYQTSDDPLMVGAKADLFIGHSNNVFYGPIKSLQLLDDKTFRAIGDQTKQSYLTAEYNGETYHIALNTSLSVSSICATSFVYPTVHIEEVLIPNLKRLRNNLLLDGNVVSEAEVQALADANKKNYYLSLIPYDSEDFGRDNSKDIEDSYKVIVPKDGAEPVYLQFGEDPATAVVSQVGCPDSVFMYNQSIKEWERVLRYNEEQKRDAIVSANALELNRSFHAGANYEYSEKYTASKTDTHEYEIKLQKVDDSVSGLRIGGVGFRLTKKVTSGYAGSFSLSNGEEQSRLSGYVLADEGDFDYLSVDILRVPMLKDNTFESYFDDIYDEAYNSKYNLGIDGLNKLVDVGNSLINGALDGIQSFTGLAVSPGRDFIDKYERVDPSTELKKCKDSKGAFVFRLRGGATACPYEGETWSKYLDSPFRLGEATLQVEVPDISVDNPVVTNVPSDQAAVFNLKLMNDSQVSGCTAIFDLAMVDEANQSGAKFSIDGVPLADGRGILVPYGEVINKVLEVRRGTAYDYENLAVVLKSQCQSDPTDTQEDIADTVYISVHFVPTASPINIKSPGDKWTLNTASPYDEARGQYYMPVTIDGYDVNFTGFHHMAIQYKPSSGNDNDWINLMNFYNDEKLFEEASGEKRMITGASQTVNFFGAEDQRYDIRAVTYSLLGTEFVTRESQTISGVKDTRRPVLFGNVQPADGVLDIEDEIRLTFNEPIAEGYMTEVKNFSVTAVRNGTNTDHTTSVTFGGDAYLSTEASRNLIGKDATVEMWILPAELGEEMTLFSHGDADNSFEVSITADLRLKVKMGVQTLLSEEPVPFKTTDWAHIAVSYDNATRLVRGYWGGMEVLKANVETTNTSKGVINLGRSVNGNNYFKGSMHEVRLWNRVVPEYEIAANKLRIYSGMEIGMAGYWPLREGRGDVSADKAQGATIHFNGAEWTTLEGLAVSFDGTSKMVVNSSEVAITPTQDYTLTLWFKAEPNSKNSVMFSNGSPIGGNTDGQSDAVALGFDAEGNLYYANNNVSYTLTGKWNDGAWHNFAVSLNRTGGNAQMFVDGELNKYSDATNFGGLASNRMYIGAQSWIDTTAHEYITEKYFKGLVDEVALWNLAMPASRIADYYNESPNGNEMGLLMYLPFSKYITNMANMQELVFSGENKVTGKKVIISDGGYKESSEKAPVVAKGAEVSIAFSYVVNNDAIVINLLDTPEALERTIVNITVKDVADLNGNLMESPVTWSAYVNRNQLRWSAERINIEKELNAPASFTVDVVNQGGTVQNFHVEGLPAWITAQPASGKLSPLASQTIEFTIDKGVNIGKYDETIYLRGDNNVAEPLQFNLNVAGNITGWDVNPSDYEYNMYVFGKLRINDLFSNDPDDRLAVFSNGKCVGVASNAMENNGISYVMLTIYSNVAKGDNLTFRMWDASAGVIYSAVPESEIKFVSNSVVGSVASPVIFDASPLQVQNIDLSKGWNWISVSVEDKNLGDINALLSGFSWNLGDIVKSEATAQYASYSKAEDKWFGSLSMMSNETMFHIYSSDAQTITFNGMAVDPQKNPITIHGGQGRWNYIPFYPTSNMTVNEALADYEAQVGDVVKSQTQFAQYAGNLGWIGSLENMQNGRGYMMQRVADNDATLTYPSVSASLGTQSTLNVNKRASLNPWSSNMTMVAVAEGVDVMEGDRMVAYVGDIRRGESKSVAFEGQSLFFLAVAGDAETETVNIAIERNGAIIAVAPAAATYRMNAHMGTTAEPVVVNFSTNVIDVYPNPFVDRLHVRLSVAPAAEVSVRIVDIMGRTVALFNDCNAYGDGNVAVDWDARQSANNSWYLVIVTVDGKSSSFKVLRK